MHLRNALLISKKSSKPAKKSEIIKNKTNESPRPLRKEKILKSLLLIKGCTIDITLEKDSIIEYRKDNVSLSKKGLMQFSRPF